MSAADSDDRPTFSRVSRPDSVDQRRRSSPLREAPRQLALIGCVALVAGMLIQPYATGSEFVGTTSRVSISDVPDAGYVIGLSIVLAAIMLNRGAAESHLRIVHIAPVAIAVAIGAILAQIIRMLFGTADRWLSGSVGPGPWLAAVGGLLAILGTTWLLVRKWPATAQRPRPLAPGAIPTERVGSGTSSEAIGILAGGLLGFVIAVAVVSPALPPAVPLGELAAILVLAPGGAWLGKVVGRRLGLG
jgi:hypothetical protein